MTTRFRKDEIAAPEDREHYVRTLMWLRQNVPELKEVSEHQMLLYGRSASKATKGKSARSAAGD